MADAPASPPVQARRLRIAVVTETYPPEINGVSITMARMVGMLLERGHAIALTRPRQQGEEASGSNDGQFIVHLTRGVPIPRYGDLQIGLASPATLADAWRKAPPDVVQVVTEGPLGWAAVAAARRLGIPVASDFHTNFHAYSRHYGMGLFTGVVAAGLRLLHNRCAATMVPTEEMRARLAARGYRRLEVVGRGIDTGLFSPTRRSASLRAAWGCIGDDPAVLYVGRLAAEKNLGLFVRAALALRAVSPRARIVLVGDGPAAARLRAAHPDFVFCGMRTGEDLAAHYASADLFLFPSSTETFGNVTTEALASGLAVVAFDYAAARQHIVHAHSGLLVPCHDEEAFVAGAVRLVDMPRRIVQIKAQARAVAEKLSWDAVIDDLERVLYRVAAGESIEAAAV